MQLYCPACKTAAHAAERCPRCGERLVAPSELTSISRDRMDDPPPLIEPTAVGRVAVAVVAAMGLELSVREMLLGSMAAADLGDHTLGTAGQWLLRAAAIIAGATLAGAGRPNGAAAGGVTAVVCGGLFLALDALIGSRPAPAELLTLATLAFLALGMGRLGATVWPAATPIPASKIRSRGSSLLPMNDDIDAPRRVDLSWWRIGLGVLVGFVGFVEADAFRVTLRSAAGARLYLGSPAEVPAVDFLFAGFALVAGGMIAGAGSGAGLRHGAVMGSLTATAVTFLGLLGRESAVTPIQGMLETLDYSLELLRSLGGLVIVLGGLTALCAVSGGFAGVLLPRLAVRARRRVQD